MNKKEFASLIAVLETAYTNFKISNEREKMRVWYTALNDLEFEGTKQAVQALILELKFTPTIAHIREKYVEMQQMVIGENKTAEEGWQIVQTAIKTYGWYRAKEGLELIKNKSERAYGTTKAIGYKEICTSENIDVVRAHFIKAYNNIATRDKKQEMLSTDVKDYIASSVKQLAESKELKG